MKTINSKDNKIYKLCIKLTGKKFRDKLELYLLEGPNLLEEALKNGAALRYVIFRADLPETVEGNLWAEIPAGGLPASCECVAMERRLFDHISQTETNQGVLAVAEKPALDEAGFFAAAAGGKDIVVLDRLQDPGNIGAILRTADAAGFAGAILIKGTGDAYGPKVVRAAAGSLFRLPVLSSESGQSAAALLRERGYRLAVSCFEEAVPYYEADLRDHTAIVIGNEGGGVSRELLELADLRVRIPMEGSIDSLNAAVAAGILMYEAVRK